MIFLLIACATDDLKCGPGTHEEGGQCLPDAGETGSTDTSSPDTGDTDTCAPDTGSPDSGAPEVLEVYLLAGQSNMDGYGVYSGLPPSWLDGREDVQLFWFGWGEFRELAPASYGGAAYTGPEVSLGWTLADAGRSVALVKHAVGGTNLYSYWYPGESSADESRGAGWSNLVASMRSAEATLDASGQPWRWAGFAWMQGESDALDATMASAYAENLERLLRRVREETAEPDLPAVLGLIACEDLCTYLDEVRAAQEAVAEADPYTTTIETLDLARSPYDPWHYDGPSTRLLGQRFAQAFLGQEPTANVEAALKVSSYSLSYDGDFTVGWVFSTDRAITITDVGAFAPSDTLLYTASGLGIWDNDSAELVAREVVPSWAEAPTSYRDGFWYAAIEPVRLEAGTYAIGLVSWGSDYDRYADNAVVEAGDAVQVEGGAYHSGYWLSYPEVQFAADADALSFLGPSFLYVED